MGLTVEWWQVLTTAASLVLSSVVLVAIINQVATRRRTAAEAEKLQAEAAKLAIDGEDVIAGNWQEIWCQMLARLKQVEERLDRERAEVTRLDGELRSLREQLGVRIVQDAERQAEMVRLRGEGAQKDAQIAALTARVQELEQTVRKLSSEMQTLCEENARLRNEADSAGGEK